MLRRTGEEEFSNRTKLVDFWRWAHSDILGNAERGRLAEYIVAMAICSDNEPRVEWDNYDLLLNNIRIEVKSSAYLQNWHQDKLSKIIFNIKPTRAYDWKTHKYSEEADRVSDVYVFCLLNEKNKELINPLDLSQWKFFVVKTEEINIKMPKQKSVTLSGIMRLKNKTCDFENLHKTILDIYNSTNKGGIKDE